MNGVYNTFLWRRAKNISDITTPGNMKALLLRSTGAYNFNPDHDTVVDLLSNGGIEINVTSYARKVLTQVQWTQDDANDYSVMKFDNIQFGNLEAGQTVVACVLYEQVGLDGVNPLIYHIDGKIRVTAAAPASAGASGNISTATNANPIVVTTSTPHGRANGEVVYISGVTVGMTQINNRQFTIGGVTTSTFQLVGENGIGYGAWSGTGQTWSLVKPVYVDPTREAINDGTAAALGAATGIVTGNHAKGVRVLNIRGLSAAIVEGDSGIFQTALNLPVNLGGGAFNVNVNSAGFLALLATKP